jgi:hypothetical protein
VRASVEREEGEECEEGVGESKSIPLVAPLSAGAKPC